MAAPTLAIAKRFRALQDPRRKHRKRHPLANILTIAVCAVIGGANGWTDIETFGRQRQDWFARFLDLTNGIPSHDTFERVFDRLDPQVFQRCLVAWLHQLSETLGIRHIAIDGKALRHSGGGSSPLRYLHLVSAWATEAELFLGQVATEEKSNEITAIPRLLELLDLHGALVSIDAMGCQKEIARTVIERGGDYVLAVKDNQEHLKADIEACFARAERGEYPSRSYAWHQTEGVGHGRQEKRVYEVIYDLAGIRGKKDWRNLKAIGLCYCERTVGGKTSRETRYFISSRACSAKRFGEVLRGHWGIENGLHWQMDVTFGEDASRIQRRHGGENFASLRRLALMLLKRHPGKGSIRSKRYAATISESFLEELFKK